MQDVPPGSRPNLPGGMFDREININVLYIPKISKYGGITKREVYIQEITIMNKL